MKYKKVSIKNVLINIGVLLCAFLVALIIITTFMYTYFLGPKLCDQGNMYFNAFGQLKLKPVYSCCYIDPYDHLETCKMFYHNNTDPTRYTGQEIQSKDRKFKKYQQYSINLSSIFNSS